MTLVGVGVGVDPAVCVDANVCFGVSVCVDAGADPSKKFQRRI